uniref:uncharacterized protein LOC120344995 n=1 Tax=Styela clava TaxID=7725 RepID=UPI00193A915F|nr:uncharacterized protein LOC120344995 [Styela clava]
MAEIPTTLYALSNVTYVISTFSVEIPTWNTLHTTCQILNAFMLLCSLWLLLSMAVYGTNTKKWKKKTSSSSLNSGIIYTSCVASIILSTTKLIFNSVFLNIHLIDGAMDWCELVTDISIGTGIICLYAIYLFLWLRQRVIYGHPCVRNLAGKTINVLSWISLFGISLIFTGLLIVSVVPLEYTSTQNACIRKETELRNIAYIVLAGVLLLVQGLLLCLFVYPMIRSSSVQGRKQQSVAESNQENYLTRDRKLFSTCRRSKNKSIIRKNRSTVSRMIRRSVICAVITVVTDIASMTFLAQLPSSVSFAITSSLYDISIFINICCALATFGKAKRILLAPFSICTKTTLSQTSSSFGESIDDTSRRNTTQPTGESFAKYTIGFRRSVVNDLEIEES